MEEINYHNIHTEFGSILVTALWINVLTDKVTEISMC